MASKSTFVKVRKSNNKKKIAEVMDTSGEKRTKKLKANTSKNDGIFTDDHMPDEKFPIGNNVFVNATIYRGFVTVHLRKYKKYGKVYFPSTEGITLRPWWIEYIMGISKVPETRLELPHGFYLPEKEIQITSEDFNSFSFKRIFGDDNAPSFKQIIISREQWNEMLKSYNNIAATVLDLMFRNMNLLDAYKTSFDGPIEKALPNSLDYSLGEDYLRKTLKKCICDLFIERGMKEPVVLAEEPLGNRTETFNSYAFSLEVMELAERFHSNLWESQNFLSLKPVHYVTVDFFENLRLDFVLREAREYMCPRDTFEYYEDCE